jgi:hypothetical protein
VSTSAVVAIVGPVVVLVLLAVLALVHRRRVRRDLEGHFSAEYGRSFGAGPAAPGHETPEVGDWSDPGPVGDDPPAEPPPSSP